MPNNKLTDIMSGIIKQAEKTPAVTGATETYIKRASAAGDETIILADVSGSMAEPAGATTKIEVLRQALAFILQNHPEAKLIAFASIPSSINNIKNLPSPSGGTALDRAIGIILPHKPKHTIIVSDGLPDNQDTAIEAAKMLSGSIDVIYCGPDNDYTAVAFMRRLAMIGGGRFVAHDITRHTSLVPVLEGMIALPEGR